MRFALRQPSRPMIALMLVSVFLVPADLMAQSHLVSPAELQQQIISASQQRQRNLEELQNFLSPPVAEKAMKTGDINARQVRTAVSTLNDQELAELSARAQKAQADFAAGNLTDRDLILIILGIAVLVLIIVAVR